MFRCCGSSFLTLVLFVSPLSASESNSTHDDDAVYKGKRVSEWVQMLGSGNPDTRDLAATTLQVIGLPAVPQLLAGLKDQNARIRVGSANTLSQMLTTPDSVLPALLESLNDSSEDVRRAASLAICQNIALNASREVTYKAAISTLSKAREHKDSRVRKLASCALARIQRDNTSAGLVDGLIEAVKDKEMDVQEQALEALGSAGPAAKTALPVLQELLKQKPDVDIRFKAVMAIAGIEPRSKATIGLLIKALEENNLNAREKTGGSAMHYSMAADKLGEIGPPAKAAIEPLSRGLRDPDGNVRVSAALALSRITPQKTQEMVRILIELLKHQDSSVRENTLAALGLIGPMAKEAVAPLTDLLRTEKESFIREGIVDTLKRIDPDSSTKKKQNNR